MIVDLIVGLLIALVSPILALLPTGSLDLPSPTAAANALRGLDSLIPILGVLQLGAVMLSALGVFLIFRAIVFVRHLVFP